MKRFLRFAALSLAVVGLWACDDDKSYADPGMEVTAHSIAGTWQLTEWQNAPLAEGSYVYIEFIRRDRKFKQYDNMESFGTRYRTGWFQIESGPSTGSVIRGNYDHTMGEEWSHRYIIRDLSEMRMVWVAADDPDDVSVYVKSSIPDEILQAGSDDTED